MFFVERREVGKVIWEKHQRYKSMSNAQIGKKYHENRYRILDYKWRVREIKVGEKA